jgi:hypothetical protein
VLDMCTQREKVSKPGARQLCSVSQICSKNLWKSGIVPSKNRMDAGDPRIRSTSAALRYLIQRS